MAPDASAPSGDVDKRIAELNRKMDHANQAVAKAKTVSLILTFVIIIAAVVGVVTMIWPLKEAYSNPEPYVTAMKTQLEHSVVPELRRTLESEEFKESLSEVGRLVGQRAEARQEEAFVAVNSEITDFITNMQEWGEGEINTRRDRIEGHIVKRLKDEVPLLDNEEQAEVIMANAQEAMSAATERILDEYLGTHLALFFSIESRLNDFPISEDIAAMDELELSDALTSELGTYATYVFRTSMSPETRGFLRELGEDD